MTFQFIPGAPDDIAQITDQAALRHFVDHADPRAFEVLTLRYQGMVLATCRRVLGATAEADDAVQETFLRLARHAKDVRSNVAAWLHACAFRTSIDLQRREGARRRAEATAAQQRVGDDTLSTWRELEPLIDEALNKLHESDRDLIVSRFLVGRPQTEMAAEAGVNPGTMHRRIDAALERLREHLRTGGVVLGAGAFAAALTHAPASAQASVALAGSLGKIALVQSAGSTASAGASAAAGWGGGVSWVAIVIAGLTLSGGTAAVLLSRSHNAATQPPPPPAAAAPAKSSGVLADKGSSFARPSREISGYTLRENYSESMTMPRLYFDGSKLYFGPDAPLKHSMDGAILRITAINPSAKPPTISFKGESVSGEVGQKARGLVGTVIDATYKVEGEGGRELTMTGNFGDDKHPSDNHAVRLSPGSSMNKSGSAEGNDPALAGSWMIVNNQELKLTQDEITFEDKPSGQPVERYRIIEWTESAGDGYAKVQTICTAYGQGRGAVGKRFKFLIRKEDKQGSRPEAYTLLSYDVDSDKRDTWPEKFEYAVDKQVRAFIFRKD
ncbi:MAG: sigma-70 family RNA polymerase sigma factor [Phycisphaerales bacterium]